MCDLFFFVIFCYFVDVVVRRWLSGGFLGSGDGVVHGMGSGVDLIGSRAGFISGTNPLLSWLEKAGVEVIIVGH